VGQLSHLGKVALDAWHCTAIDWATGEFVIAGGEIVLTAANADTLTGRFADASGTLMESGLSTWLPFPTGSDPRVREIRGTFSGEISFDASDRGANQGWCIGDRRTAADLSVRMCAVRNRAHARRHGGQHGGVAPVDLWVQGPAFRRS
jgi:hypothetical protein